MKKILCVFAAALTLVGCGEMFSSSDDEYRTIAVRQDADDEEREVNVLTSPIVSDPSNDPYTVENMTKALRISLSAKETLSKADVDQMTLEPNYLYVRFLAEGHEGVARLKAHDTALTLFKHPLDYKDIQKPVVYRDPTLPDTVFPFFATVPVGYDFGPTKYEVIKELFLVEPLDGDCDEEECDEEEDRDLVAAASKKAARKLFRSTEDKLKSVGLSLRDVEMESLRMTGNLDARMEPNRSTNGVGTTAKWTLFGKGKKLGGQLKFMDDQLGEQPLVGVRVTGGYSYYWRTTHTDKDGKFKIPERWNFSIDYEANFDAEDFLLENGHSWYGEDLEIEKNNKYSDWKETFKGSRAKWCVVWTAAYQYWYGDNYGLKRPRQNEWWNMSMDIQVYWRDSTAYEEDANCEGKTIGCTETGSHDERIWIDAYEKESWLIYSTTIHEVSHTSQYWNMKTTDVLLPQSAEYKNLPKKYKETYARGMENYFSGKRYGKKRRYEGNYTGLVEDLLDKNNSSSCTKIADMNRRDKVGGFPITGIEKAFFENKSFSAMKKYLKSKYPSGKNGVSYTAESMDDLFQCWGIK